MEGKLKLVRTKKWNENVKTYQPFENGLSFGFGERFNFKREMKPCFEARATRMKEIVVDDHCTCWRVSLQHVLRRFRETNTAVT